MKKIYSLLVLSLISISSFSQNTSNLVVFSEDGLKFYLVLNGIRQNETAQVNVKVSGLNQPYYSAKIIFEDAKNPVLEKKYLAVVDQESNTPLEVTYKIKRNNKMVNVLRYFSAVPIAQAAPSSPEVQEITYHSTPLPEIESTVTTHETTTIQTGTNGTNTNANTNVSINVGGIGMNVNINDPVMGDMNTTTTTTTTKTTTKTSSSSSVNQVQSTPSAAAVSKGCGGAVPMTSSSFASAKKTISGQSFEDTRLTTAKQIMKSNCVSSAQIKELMNLFSFEANRLEVAKFAHNYCTDTNNYFILNDAFQFESSVEELNNAISH